MPIENRNLGPGTKLVGKYHKQQYRCEVIKSEGDKLRYRLEDGREFKSLSAVGTAITGQACNGWAFWSVETTQKPQPATAAQPEATAQVAATEPVVTPEPPKEAPAEQVAAVVETDMNPEPVASAAEGLKLGTADVAQVAETPAPAKKNIFRLLNQKGAPEGQTKWHCRTCAETFLMQANGAPSACPQGHPAA